MYVGLLDPVPWKEVGLSALQTVIIFWLVLIGIKLAGRRVFGEMGPQDMILLLLVAEACDLGLTHEDAGFWGTLASILTILITGAIIERIPFFRSKLDDKPMPLLKNGKPDLQVMKKALVEDEDLMTTARQYGFPDYSAFERMTLEPDGKITATFKPEYRKTKAASAKKAGE